MKVGEGGMQRIDIMVVAHNNELEFKRLPRHCLV
jgi:hypothetical protein